MDRIQNVGYLLHLAEADNETMSDTFIQLT